MTRCRLAIFNPDKLAPAYTEADITEPISLQRLLSGSEAPVVAEAGFKLELSGLIGKKESWTLEQLRALPQERRSPGTSASKAGAPSASGAACAFSDFLQRVGADTSAKYVGFKCADDYHTSIDMATALHPQTMLALTFDGQVLPPNTASR